MITRRFPSPLSKSTVPAGMAGEIQRLALALLVAVAASTHGSQAGNAPPASERPNVLWIGTDQLRFDALGCNGNPVCQTPALDRLASQGIRFTRAYTTC